MLAGMSDLNAVVLGQTIKKEADRSPVSTLTFHLCVSKCQMGTFVEMTELSEGKPTSCVGNIHSEPL